MADRPGRGGTGDGPDFTWLYGGKGAPDGDPDATRAMRRQPRPDDEATQVMRSQPRAAAAPPADPTAPRRVQPAPAPASGSPGRTRRGWRPRLRRPRLRLRTLLAVLLLWVVFLVAVPVVAWLNVEKVAWEPKGARPDDQPGTTYLMVGSDSRAGLSEEERRELGTGNDAGDRTDTIMVLHTGKGPNLLMSIPRDSPADASNGKINGTYAAGGPKGLVSAVEDLTGIRIDQYMEIGMGGVVGIVDAVGGIEICPKARINDPKAKLNIKKGCQEADGRTALGYSRTRASALSDLARVQQQREVVSAIGRKVVSPWSVLNPVRYYRLNNALPDFFTFGEGMNPVRAGMWAFAMTRVNGENGLTCTVPLADGSATWDQERSQQMFQAIIDDDTESIGKDLCTPSGLPAGATGG